MGLQAHDFDHPRGLFDQIDAEVRYPEITKLSLLLDPLYRLEGLLEGGVGVGPMDLPQIDHIDAQPTEGGVNLLVERLRLQITPVLVRCPNDAAFRRDDEPFTPSLDCSAYYLFRMTGPIGRCGIDERDSRVDRRLNCAYRLLVFHPSPEVVANCPRSKADDRHLERRLAEFPILQ